MHQFDYITVNKELWNKRAEHHPSSDFYCMDDFLKGKNSLNDIELQLLGDVRGKSVLHLQCHFGQDSLSLARMGAKVTGVDFSDTAIQKAMQLNEELSLDAGFIHTDIFSLPEVLDGQYDIVFASYGVVGWLPDMKRWAEIVARYIKPGGRFVFAEFHPVVWMFNAQFSEVQYSYFNHETIEEMEQGSYADGSAPYKLPSISWNHNLAEVMQSLIDAGLSLTYFGEYDYSPYNAFANMVEVAPGHYHLKGLQGKLPMVYALQLSK